MMFLADADRSRSDVRDIPPSESSGLVYLQASARGESRYGDIGIAPPSL